LRVLKESKPTGTQSRQRRALEGSLRNRHYREIQPVKKRMEEVETEVARITARIREIEAALADPEHYRDSERVVETNMEYRGLKESLKKLTNEWDGLVAESERLRKELKEAMKNISESA
jgi:ATP-binding cassette subfamily F protein 3